MSATISTTERFVSCDDCGEKRHFATPESFDAMYREAAQSGWYVESPWALCPACIETASALGHAPKERVAMIKPGGRR